MGSYEELVQQLRSDSAPAQHQAVAALSKLPLVAPRSWLSAAGAIPRLVQLMHSASTAAPLALAIRYLLQHFSTFCECGEIQDFAEAPDGVIPPLVIMLRRRDDAMRGSPGYERRQPAPAHGSRCHRSAR